MAIKGLSDIRRLPRLGKIRLGIKKKTAAGVEYPAEVNYFICDPQTPSELENKKIMGEFEKLYGKEPKSIRIMFPVANPDVYFPQFYKRYGSGTSLKCKGDGVEARCGTEEFAAGLTVIRKDEMGLPIVKCAGKDCAYYKKKECGEDATLQILLPELPGAGVWQITTGSFHSIVNLNSCIDYIIAVCGRAHMIPLQLERRKQETTHEGKKANHYILHVNMDFRLADLQKYALIEPTRMLLELPAPEEDKEDILLRQNQTVNPQDAAEQPTGKTPCEYPEFDEPPVVDAEEVTDKPPLAADEVVGEISDITSKSGEKDGKPWTVYHITVDGMRYGTFSATFADMARTVKEAGGKVRIKFNQQPKGRTIALLTEEAA